MIDRENFEKSLSAATDFWGNKNHDEVAALLGVNVARMVGFDQKNPHHCYDLFVHTFHTVDGIGNDESELLRVAAFFHDIAKPLVAVEKCGRLVFYGHAEESADIALSLLRDMGYTQSDIERICFFISHHDDFISWVLPTEHYNRKNPHLVEITAENVLKHITKTAQAETVAGIESFELWRELLKLCYADASAQAEKVYRDGKLMDSRAHKLKKIDAVRCALCEVFQQ